MDHRTHLAPALHRIRLNASGYVAATVSAELSMSIDL
jgi:hypothetical protein